ncbi:Arabinogalactan protein 41 [Ranunculus cassubicifolius]
MNSSIIFAVMLLLTLLQLGYGQEGFAPSPAPISDGNTIDQGIAYLLMLVALAITYMFH